MKSFKVENLLSWNLESFRKTIAIFKFEMSQFICCRINSLFLFFFRFVIIQNNYLRTYSYLIVNFTNIIFLYVSGELFFYIICARVVYWLLRLGELSFLTYFSTVGRCSSFFFYLFFCKISSELMYIYSWVVCKSNKYLA